MTKIVKNHAKTLEIVDIVDFIFLTIIFVKTFEKNVKILIDEKRIFKTNSKKYELMC